MVVDRHEPYLSTGAVHRVAPVASHAAAGTLDAAEPIGVDVRHRAERAVLVANDGLNRIEITEQRQACPSKYPNQSQPIAIGRNNWLLACSLRTCKRATAIMSLVHSARPKGHDPYASLRDILDRLPIQPASRIDELLLHRWRTNTTI